MRLLVFSTLLGLALGPVVQAAELDSNEQKAFYVIGYNIGNQLGQQFDSVDYEAFLAGMKDAISQTAPALSETEAQAAFAAIQQAEQQKQAAVAQQAQQANNDFLANNSEKQGVVTTDSGLQYRVIKEGIGDTSPGPDAQVKTHYHGTLVDGTVFDSSIDRGEPVSFPVNAVIPGWTEALQLMTVGDRWELVIPPELAYGANPPGSIPPNAVLIFEVELLEIN